MRRRAKLGSTAVSSAALLLLVVPCAFGGCSSSSGDDSSGQNQGDAASGNDGSSNGDASKNDGSSSGDASGGGCAADQTTCGGECVSTSRDTANCGSCGHACASDEVCSAGTCAITCSSGLTMCSGVANIPPVVDAGADAGDASADSGAVDAGIRAPYCANLVSENDNCGACGFVCPGSLACRDGSCTHYSGVTGAWTTLASFPDGDNGFTDFSPPGTSAIYSAGDDTDGNFYRYDPSADAWTTLTSSPEAFTGNGEGSYSGPAWVGDAIYAFAPDKVMKFDIALGTWSAPLTTTINVEDEGQHTHDDSGHVYAVAADGNLLKYDVTAKTIATVTLSAPLTNLSEPRLEWDSATHLLFAAPSFHGTELDSIDPTTGTVTLLAPNPGTQVSDIFCADRNGHLYAMGGNSVAQLYQYVIATNTWTLLSNNPPPFNGSNDGACTVTSDGWLYFTDGEGDVAKLQLF
jgi:hypothetical protein